MGAAYVFVRNGTTWTQQQKLTASDGVLYDHFGISVAISGNTVVVGAGGWGAAYIFVRSGTTWTQQQKLIASDGAVGDLFGDSVAISWDTVVVGAPSPYYPYPGQGAAYVFVRSGTTWTQQQKLTASDSEPYDQFGASVAISGDTVVVGRPDYGAMGAAYVFVRSGTTWTQQQKLTASDGKVYDFLGYTIAISGNTMVIGAPISNIGANTYQGAAYVFARSGTTWTQQQKLTASDGGFNHWFGTSVAISADKVVVGAIGVDYGSGAAYVFVP